MPHLNTSHVRNKYLVHCRIHYDHTYNFIDPEGELEMLINPTTETEASGFIPPEGEEPIVLANVMLELA